MDGVYSCCLTPASVSWWPPGGAKIFKRKRALPTRSNTQNYSHEIYSKLTSGRQHVPLFTCKQKFFFLCVCTFNPPALLFHSATAFTFKYTYLQIYTYVHTYMHAYPSYVFQSCVRNKKQEDPFSFFSKLYILKRSAEINIMFIVEQKKA